MGKETTTLEKGFSREHTLFYFGVWQENNLHRMERWAVFNAEHILFVRDESGVVSVWYNPKEIERFNKGVKNKIQSNSDYFDDFKNEFQNRWKELEPYLKEEQEITSLKELKQFYEEWAEWWTLMVMSMNIPEIQELPEDIKEEALQLRKKTQEYMDAGDTVFKKFFEKNFPEYEGISEIILPREVFSLQVRDLTEKEVEEIRGRKGGCAILNEEVFTRDKLDKKLEANNLELKKKETDQVYEKEFTRNYSLPMLEVWYKGEAYDEKPWLKEEQKYLPYIVFVREQGTVKSFYDPHGVEWVKAKIRERIEQGDSFLELVAKKVQEKLSPIEQDYKDESTLDKQKLLQFIESFREAYPWVETMWWVMHMKDDNELPESTNTKVLEQVREMTNDLTSGTDAVVRNSLEEIYPSISDFVHVLRVDEIRNNDISDQTMLEKRDNSFIFTDNKLFVEADITEIEEEYGIVVEKEDTDNIDKLEGQTAYEGKVTGTVKVVMNKSQLEKVNEGDIIVSPMTMPDFVPAMRRAAAFVTDEGGVTSHAAITAREMEKPCFVGADVATKLLEDGDEVEVDADEGVVTILNN